jgi:methylenetetrahydrofolate dehydrogenase (NADP+) / methenyltetrahydrofolate cyclohydrolase
MKPKLLTSKVISQQLEREIEAEIKKLRGSGREFKLVAIETGDDPGSSLYLSQQKKNAGRFGIGYQLEKFSDSVSQDEVLDFISESNADPGVSGIILQRPVCRNLDLGLLQNSISPVKDVEGVHAYNAGRLVSGDISLVPPTVSAVLALIELTGVDLKGKEAVVIGHSDIVGKPLVLSLLKSKTVLPTVTVCHIATRDLQSHTLRADILITAVGKPGLVTDNMVKPGSIVIDVGINRVVSSFGRDKAYKIVGDVDFERVSKICSFITPVPGGVGPVTSLMLIKNLVKCIKLQLNNNK